MEVTSTARQRVPRVICYSAMIVESATTNDNIAITTLTVPMAQMRKIALLVFQM